MMQGVTHDPLRWPKAIADNKNEKGIDRRGRRMKDKKCEEVINEVS